MQKNQGSRFFNSGRTFRAKSKALAKSKLVDSAEQSSANTANKTEETINRGRPPSTVDPTHRFGKSSGNK